MSKKTVATVQAKSDEREITKGLKCVVQKGEIDHNKCAVKKQKNLKLTQQNRVRTNVEHPVTGGDTQNGFLVL